MLFAESISGTCGAVGDGSNLQWTLDNRVLTISGTGKMRNYNVTVDAPWYLYRYNIDTILVQNGVTSIGSYAFKYVQAESIYIASSVTEIDYDPFWNCSRFKKMVVDPANNRYDSRDNCNAINETETNTLIRGCETSIIPNSITHIGDGAFSDCTYMRCITIPENITHIGKDVFCDCAYLDTIIWKAKRCSDFTDTCTPFWRVRTICDIRSQITSFVFGNNVEYIPAYLCYGLSNVDNIYIPCSVQTIGENAFGGCNTSTSTISNILPDTIICHRGAEICDNNNDCQMFYESGTFTRTYKTIDGCDSIVTRNIIIRPDTTFLPEITINKGEWFSPSGNYEYRYVDSFEESQWSGYYNEYASQEFISSFMYSGSQTDTWFYFNLQFDCERYRREHGTCDELTQQEFETWYKSHFHEYASECPEGVECEKTAVDGERLYSSKIYENIYTTSSGCDSVVIRNVNVEGPIDTVKIEGLCYALDKTNQSASVIHNRQRFSYESMAFRNEYSGNIVIPDSIWWKEKYWPVTSIGDSAFQESEVESVIVPKFVEYISKDAFLDCSQLKYIQLRNDACQLESSCYFRKIDWSYYYIYYYGGLNSRDAVLVYVPFGSLRTYQAAYNDLNFHVIKTENIQSSVNATSVVISFGDTEEQRHIVSCGVVDGEEFLDNKAELHGLEPNREYKDIEFYINTFEGDCEIIMPSFKTSALILETQPSKPVSSTTAILLANTNMADIETSCGFEWKRNDAPADMDGTKAYCPVANGTMAGRLKGLNENTYYKYRAFYQSSAGNMYYGDWQYIFTGDNIVEFEPILYTYEAVSVKENEATLKGYALAGSDDFTEQGFEYWAESRVQQEGRMARRVSAALGEHKTITASGISMKATLTGLDAGTVYKYRTYAKLGNQTIYGSEMSFTTKGEYTGSEDINNIPCTPVVSSRKILRNGQILILRGDKTYTLQGQEVK